MIQITPDEALLLRVGQLAERTGKTVRAIRFYEELGLLEPVNRTKGGFRQYDGQAILRVEWIERLQELGFSLTEVSSFLDHLRAKESGPAAMDELRAFYIRKLSETRAHVQRLVALETELKASLGYLMTCQSCAPATQRSACHSCGADEHQNVEPPALVAGATDPHPSS